MSLFKEKSWSVRLVNGYVLNSQVKSEHCRGCESATKLIVAKNGEPDMLLYGCNGHKCRHILIRVEFPDIDQDAFSQPPITFKSSAIPFQEIPRPQPPLEPEMPEGRVYHNAITKL